MTLKTSTTGSYPPLEEDTKIQIHEFIERAIRDQLELDLDILVDGQVRDDIVSLFAKAIPELSGDRLPYRVKDRIRPLERAITVQDYEYASKLIPGDSNKPLKAHVTGPMTIARSLFIETPSYEGIEDKKLIFDLAEMIGQEAKYLVQAGAKIVQIDEPVLAKGVDLNIAFEAMKIIVNKGEIPYPALHACGNVTGILEDVLQRFPVKMISMEGEWLKSRELRHIQQSYLQDVDKVIGLGCIKVSNYQVERLLSVQNFLDQMISRLGEDRIWAAMPNCGLRAVPYDVAKEKLKVLVEAAHTI